MIEQKKILALAIIVACIVLAEGSSCAELSPAERIGIASVVIKEAEKINPKYTEEKCRNPGYGNIVIGQNAGAVLLDGSCERQGSCNILIGNNADVPSCGVNNFVNIGGNICFDRITGEKKNCPAVACAINIKGESHCWDINTK